jgi:hypothetical protein
VTSELKIEDVAIDVVRIGRSLISAIEVGLPRVKEVLLEIKL